MDESTESFVVLLSKGPMQQAVQPGNVLHLGSEYDANNPTSLTSLWDSKAAQVYSAWCPPRSSNSSSLNAGRGFPADWKLLYNAHHFTDFLAWPIFASPPPPAGGGTGMPSSLPADSATSATAAMRGLASAAAAEASASYVVGALTLYLSRPGGERVSEPLPSIFGNAVEQELVSLAFAGVLFSGGPEPVRQVCELVVAMQSAAGSGEVAAAVAASLQARLRHILAVSPTALLALVPPRQVSAVVFRDLTAPPPEGAAGGPEGVGGGGTSSSQTLPLLHPALASVAGGGMSYSGSHSHGGGASIRGQYRNAGIQLGPEGAVGAGGIERTSSLLGTGLRGEAAGAAGGVGGTGATPNSLVADGPASRPLMPNSRSLNVLHGPNPSGLFSCRLDRMPSRYKALVFPLSHTLLQVVLQQRQERRLKEQQVQRSGTGGVPTSASVSGGAGGLRAASALRDMCMSAATAAANASGTAGGGWIVSDCNEHLHAVHSPSRDVYVMARVNGQRPHSLVLATAELTGLGGGAEGGGAGAAGAGGVSGSGGSTHIALYLAFPERLPRPLLEMALADTQLIMRKLIAPLIRQRFEGQLSEEWLALAAGANNLPTPGGPVLRIASSISASQARHTPPVPAHLLLLSAANHSAHPQMGDRDRGEVSPSAVQEPGNSTWLSRLGSMPAGASASAAAASPPPPGVVVGGGSATAAAPASGALPSGLPSTTASELHLEGLSAGEALQQMSVLVSSYMDTLQALQGQLMASDRVAESLRREDLPHLQLLEVLGHGGGGVVFRGKLHALEVAVKVFEVPGDLATAAGLASLSPQHANGGGKGGDGGGGAHGSAGAGGEEKQAAWPAVGDRRVLQRSALELAVTASISHPHIIQVYSLYTNMVLVKQKPPRHGTSGVQLLELSAATALSRAEEGIPCSALCMEYCDMGTLAHAIDQHRFMTVTPLGSRRPALKAICTTLLEVALALRHLHARNLAHCDLKPANVLLKSSRRDSRGFTCKLADFGYVSVLKAAVPGGRPTILPEEACGTVTHMAPETFIKGQPLDFSVDTFSFGILMWELYTCARPYSDVPEDQIAQRVTLKGLRPSFPADTPRAYGALARQCWSQDPNERPSASEIVAAIENMLQIMNTQLPAIPPLKPKTPNASPATGGAAAAPAASATAAPRSADKGVGAGAGADKGHAAPSPLGSPGGGAAAAAAGAGGGAMQPPSPSPLGRGHTAAPASVEAGIAASSTPKSP